MHNDIKHILKKERALYILLTEEWEEIQERLFEYDGITKDYLRCYINPLKITGVYIAEEYKKLYVILQYPKVSNISDQIVVFIQDILSKTIDFFF